MAVSEDRVVAGLESLRTKAPKGFAEKTLDRLGLADAYVQVDGPIGPLFVAYGPHGISLVSVLQKTRAEQHEAVPVVMMTHEARERDMRAALVAIDRLPVVAGPLATYTRTPVMSFIFRWRTRRGECGRGQSG